MAGKRALGQTTLFHFLFEERGEKKKEKYVIKKNKDNHQDLQFFRQIPKATTGNIITTLQLFFFPPALHPSDK